MHNINREPTHPGEILGEKFLTPFGLTQTELATRLHTSFRAVNEIINKKEDDLESIEEIVAV